MTVDRECPTGKVGAPTRQAILEHARRMRFADRVRAYRCDTCPRWHVTTQSKGDGDGLPDPTSRTARRRRRA